MLTPQNRSPLSYLLFGGYSKYFFKSLLTKKSRMTGYIRAFHNYSFRHLMSAAHHLCVFLVHRLYMMHLGQRQSERGLFQILWYIFKVLTSK